MSGNASNPAHGGFARNEHDFSAMSKQYSSRDMPSHTRLKYRQSGQTSKQDLLQRDLKAELEKAERKRGLDCQTIEEEQEEEVKKPRSITSSSYMPALPPSHRDDLLAKYAALDADDPLDPDSDEDEDDDEDDASELYAELNRLKRERAAEEMRMKIHQKAEEERIRKDNFLKGNPIFNLAKQGGDFSVRRRWNDDVVFKNCADKDINSDRKSKTFINDSLRSNFHRRFMDKYIR
ncbi:hypothetical protein ACOME3_010507 [Neoechinorhynchus agilis]